MCGILSYYSKFKLSDYEVSDCLNSLQSIKHRGPDGEGAVLINTVNGEFKTISTEDTPNDIESENTYNSSDYNLFLGHRRLSVIDLSLKGHQPMKFKNNWISYNGEIYNFIEIRKELILNGYDFVSSTDTEVVIKAYDFWGEKCLSKFNGMWSFVIWDNSKKSIFISNDRFGVKPLYFFKNNDLAIYSSEICQFKCISKLKLSVNTENCDLYLNHGYFPLDNTTYYNEVNRFPKSSFSWFNFNEKFIFKISPYYSIFSNQKKMKIQLDEAQVVFSELLADSIRIRKRSDVDIGISISGGIDSTLILQYYNSLNDKNKIKTFSAISPNMKGDESSFIYEVQKYFNLESYFANPFEEFDEEDFFNFLYSLEFPPKTMSFYAQWIIARLMKKNRVTINLVGQGADEIFGGYHTHYIRYFRFLILKGNLITYFNEINAYSKLRGIKKNILHRIVLLEIGVLIMFKSGLKKLDNKLLNHWNKLFDITDFLKNDFNVYQLPFFLHSDDRNSMAHSIETRHPFLDYRLVEFGYSLPENFYFKNGWSKYILRMSMDESLKKIKWRKDKKGYTIPNEMLLKKILPNSSNLEYDFRKLCLEKIIY